jgi:hypothetical protein
VGPWPIRPRHPSSLPLSLGYALILALAKGVGQNRAKLLAPVDLLRMLGDGSFWEATPVQSIWKKDFTGKFGKATVVLDDNRGRAQNTRELVGKGINEGLVVLT